MDNETYYIISTKQELLADLETPVSTFHKICKNKPFSFLLESVEGNEKLGRYSVIGTEPILLLSSKDNQTYLDFLEENKKKKRINLDKDPFIALENTIKKTRFIGKGFENFLGFVGYFGFETVRWIEPKTKFNSFKKAPDVYLMLPGKLIIFDHILHKVILISTLCFQNKKEVALKQIETKRKLNKLLGDFKKPDKLKVLSVNYEKKKNIAFKSNYKKSEYIKIVNRAKKYIKKGDIFQVVPSQKLTIKGKYSGLDLYRVLRSINPSPYLFYLRFKDFEIAGSSPEVMVKCENQDKKRIAYLRPIAGTYPRGKNEQEDFKNTNILINDKKERAEHIMLVDLARNDLGRVCKSGSVKVKELMVIEKYSHVMHIVSLVEGILKKGETSINLLRASFPAGTLSGAPKVRALEIINELENKQRGPYGGCTGFFGLNDTINTCMTIRTFVIYKNHLEIQAGGGIVADSNPINEYKETIRKGAALLKAISALSQ